MHGSEPAPLHMEVAAEDKPAVDSRETVEGREKGGGGAERGKADGKRKDCFGFGAGGGVSSSSSDLEGERHRQVEQWNPKGPGVMETHPEAGKQQRGT